MYNHYIPQSDGSFRRNPVPEPNRRPPRQGPPVPTPAPPPSPTPPPAPAPPPPPPERPEGPPPPPPKPEPGPPPRERPLDFLRRLLPKELDVYDLLIIGLLLLLSSDEQQESLSPLLTIALYFIL